MKSVPRYLVLIFLLCNLSLLCAQTHLNKHTLGNTSQVCLEIHSVEDLYIGLKKGVKSFIPGNISYIQLSKLFTELPVHLHQSKSNNYILINIFQKDSVWHNAIIESQLNNFALQPRVEKSDSLFTQELKTNQVIIFTKEASEVSFGINDFIAIYRDDSICCKTLTNDFMLMKLETDSSSVVLNEDINQWLRQNKASDITALKTLLYKWRETGKRPQFVWCQPHELDVASKTIKLLNKIPFRSVYFTKNNQPFAPVKIKEDSLFISGGRVSIPTIQLRQNKSEITPYSKGYRFSPDVFRFTHEHAYKEIEIKAFPLLLEQKRLVHFHFDKMQTPGSPLAPAVFSTSQEMMQEDAERGNVFYFDGKKDYIDCGSNIDIDFNEGLTISTWIKPEATDHNHSIIGLGNSFSMKVRRSQLTFTLTDIIDIHIDSATIQQDKWQHVAIVNEPKHRVSLFLNGNKIGSAPTESIVNNQHALLIGSNIWGEHYKGYMDDLMIWNRALSDDEILTVSQLPQTTSKINSTLILAVGLLLLVLLIVMYRIYKKYSLTQKNKVAKEENTIQKHTRHKPVIAINKNDSCILLFDEFQIITAEGINIATKLSPKEKQLFIYILWHSIRSKNGGVTSRKLSEDLWPGMPGDKAKNNRSTYMQRLRKQLNQTTGIQINYNASKKWCMVLPKTYQCDLNYYVEALSQLKNLYSLDNLQHFLNTLGEGRFLPETHNEVIDVIKNEIENEIIVILTEPKSNKIYQNHPHIIPAATATIRKYDPLSETALTLDLQWLNSNGHHGRAMETYHRFCHDFEALYSVKFSKEMEDLLI